MDPGRWQFWHAFCKMGATSLLNVTGDWAASAIAQPPRNTVTKRALIIVTSRNQGASTDWNILLRNFFQWNPSASWFYCPVYSRLVAARSTSSPRRVSLREARLVAHRLGRAYHASNRFKWRHYLGEIILWCVWSYLRFP